MAARELKQSTAATVKIGPFVGTTGTVLTALSIVQADIRVSKNGGNMAQKNEGTACVHDELGVYDCVLDATDTGTLGILRLDIDKSGSAALSVWEIFEVVTANYYDTKYGTDRFEVDVQEIDGASAGAVNMQNFYDGTGYAGGTIKLITTGGTVDSIATGGITSSSFAADAIDAAAIAGSAVVAATLATGTISAEKIASAAITAAKIAGDAITEAKIADDAIAAEHLAGSAIVAATLATSAITADKLASNTITAAKIAGDAITEAKIADDAIAAEHIAGSAIVAATLATGTITSAKFGADAIDAAAVAGSALVAASFATGAITADKIAGDAITAAKIADDAIAAEHIAGSALVAASFATGTITSTKFAADAINAAAIAGSALGIASFDTTYRQYVAEGIPKNVAYNLHVLMVSSSDHRTGATGLSTMTMTRTMGSAGSWVSGSAAISEIGNGFYLAELTATDTNADVITYRFYCTADSADDTFIGVKTSA